MAAAIVMDADESAHASSKSVFLIVFEEANTLSGKGNVLSFFDPAGLLSG
jgi:hypothetical protein